MNNELIIRKSCWGFKLGDKVVRYRSLPHYVVKHREKDAEFCYTTYFFNVEGVEVILWCRKGIIESICCDESCKYQGHELIKMNYDDFLSIINEQSVDESIEYVPKYENWGQNQHVYDFDKSSLQIWVWRNKIRTVIVSDDSDD